MRSKITVDGREMNVDFSGYFDSPYENFLFTQVMCDVFMPGNEVVPIAIEKEQIRKIVAGFKKRPALYEELKQEMVQGKQVYVITPRMRYDLEWLAGKKKWILTKDKPPVAVSENPLPQAEAESAKPRAEKPLDSRRRYLESQGFRYDEAAGRWARGSIRFPDALVDKPATDEEFRLGMNRLVEADEQAKRRRKK